MVQSTTAVPASATIYQASDRADDVGGWPWLSLAEPVVQGGVTASGADSANGVADGFFGADQHDEFLGPGNGGVEQVALQHHPGAGGDRDDHAGVFAALGTVDADGVGVGQFVQFTELVVDVLVLVGAHGERLVDQILNSVSTSPATTGPFTSSQAQEVPSVWPK
jgi:hypothetical protein